MTKTPSLSLRLRFSRGGVRPVASGSYPESIRHLSGADPVCDRHFSGLHPVSFWRFSGRFAHRFFLSGQL
jgi:hypothetical protein